MSIKINVINQRLNAASSVECLVSGSQNFVKFEFYLDESWDGLTVFAQFRQADKAYNQYLTSDNCAYLPAEIVAGDCILMLYGSGNTVIATTNYIKLKINKDMLIADASSTEITQSLYNQLVNKFTEFINGDELAEQIDAATAAEVTKQLQENAILGKKMDKVDTASAGQLVIASEDGNVEGCGEKYDAALLDLIPTVAKQATWDSKQSPLISGRAIRITSDGVISSTAAKLYVVKYASTYTAAEETEVLDVLNDIISDTADYTVYISAGGRLLPATVEIYAPRIAVSASLHYPVYGGGNWLYTVERRGGVLHSSAQNLYTDDMLEKPVATANAPSVLAVAKYVNHHDISGFELINTITSSAASDQMTINQDASGDDISLDMAWVFAEVPAGSASGTVYVRYDDDNDVKIASMSITGAINTAARYWNSCLENRRGIWHLVQTSPGTTNGSVAATSSPVAFIGLAQNGISSVKLVKGGTAQIPAGTKLTLYGIRRITEDV